MKLIDDIRNRSQAEKIRLIWTVVISAIVVLIGLWIISARFGRQMPKDTVLFDTIGQGVKDIRDNFKK